MTITDVSRGQSVGNGTGLGAPVEFDRTPPHDLPAEQSVLGGMLLSKDAIADVVEVIRSSDFYRPAHATVFEIVGDLYGRGEPADVISVAAELGRRDLLERVGGAGYLHTLISSVPTAANAGYYARIVAEKAVLRRLAEAGTRIVQLAFGPAQDVDDVVDRAQAAVYEVTERRTSEDYAPLGDLLNPALEEIEAIAGHDGTLTGVPTGFHDLDELTNGLHGGQLWIVAARPAVGKSTLGLDLARSASIKNRMTSVIFSLEMSRMEITMRLLSAEARVSLQNIRTGRLSDDDWQRLARRMGEVAEAPLFIDDSPHLTMMEIRAKARRLKQRNGLRLVVLDYLQLMSSPKRVESRQQEVSEISRSMKLLAKELDIPVVAISQLNRASEQRADKKPQLSDLRESGCLTGDTRLVRADTGAEVSLAELVLTGERDVPVWSVDEDLRLVRARLTHAFPSGTKDVYELRLRSGRVVRASANHQFLTLDGWRRLDELSAGTRIAAPRLLPEPATAAERPEAEVVMLAHLLGDGCVAPRQPIHYTSADEANVVAVETAAAHFGITPRRVRQENWWHVYLPAPQRLARGRRNPIAAWLDGMGHYGLRSYEKFVPEMVFGLPRAQVALFLRHLWATDGSVRWDVKVGQARIYYASTSRRLVDDMARLLLRFGIYARVRTARKPPYRDGYHLTIEGVENHRIFLTEIGVHGARGENARLALRMLGDVVPNTNLDTVPKKIWDRVRDALTERSMSHRAFASAIGVQFCGSTLWRHAPSRSRLAKVADVLDDAGLHLVATSDVYWDEVASIVDLGPQPVFDATVVGTHNFLADGIVAHNSLEQDADAVILLYREDAVERESARAGEADLIIAKHRNGPTGTVTVAFQGHYSRFVDMAT